MATHPTPPCGLMDGPLHLFAVRVYYEDTDLSGIVYHANYLKWFERARSDLLRLLGVDQRAASETGAGHYAVADLAIRYAAPARLDDEVLIQTDTQDLRAASLRLRQRALRLDRGEGGQLLAEMNIRVGFVGPDGRACRQPAAWRQAFSNAFQMKEAE